MVILQYEPKNTIIHRLHPAPKLLWIFAMALVGSIFYDPRIVLIFLGLDLIFVLLARIPWRGWLNQITYVAMLSWFAFFLFSLWQTTAEKWVNLDPDFATTVLLDLTSVGTPILGRMAITYGGLLYALGMSLRVLVVLYAFCIFIYSTSPEELVSFLRGTLHFPAKVTFIVMATYRFFPDILNKLGTIKDAQSLRGWDPRSINPIKVVREYMPLAVPAMTELTYMSTAIALSTEAKGFGSPNFIILKQLNFSLKDLLLCLFTVLLTFLNLYLFLNYKFGIL